jgi:hypothetical protein
MTNLVDSTPITIRQLRLSRIRFPKLDIGATITAMSTSVVQAYRMAYFEPFNALRPRPSVPNDIDLEGRDPNW